MKIYRQLLALCLWQANVWNTAAFLVKAPKAITVPSSSSSSSPVVLRSAETESNVEFDMFPTIPPLEVIQGGGTVKTYQMPPWAERCQMYFRTNGRPLKLKVELWLGPIRRTHQMEIYAMDGDKTPFQTTLKFKKASQVLKVFTSESQELPILAGVSVPPPDRAKELEKNTEKVFNEATPEQKQLVQGGSTLGGGGAIRTWIIPDDVDSIQLVGWARDTGKKSFRARIEILQGPNNKKQEYMLQCGGGSQPYHAVFQTPGPGWMVRIRNLKFLEDGLVQFAIVPYETSDKNLRPPGPDRQWWE